MLSLVTHASLAISLTHWESHGQISTAAAAKLPAVNETLIAAINADPKSTWKAGINKRFEGATLADAKVLMGVLQNEHPSTLPYKAPPSNSLPTDFDWRTTHPRSNVGSRSASGGGREKGADW